MIYLDYPAASWPKPASVTAAMSDYSERAGGNPCRSGQRLSIAAGRIVYDTREAPAQFFGISDPLRVIFTLNATHALNQKAGLKVKLIATPRELSSDCGIALQFEAPDREQAEQRLTSAGVEFEIARVI